MGRGQRRRNRGSRLLGGSTTLIIIWGVAALSPSVAAQLPRANEGGALWLRIRFFLLQCTIVLRLEDIFNSDFQYYT